MWSISVLVLFITKGSTSTGRNRVHSSRTWFLWKWCRRCYKLASGADLVQRIFTCTREA